MGKNGVVLTFICILATIVSCEKARFDNYRVFTVGVESEDQINVLLDLERMSSSGYDFWTSPTKIGRSVDIMVPPHKSAEFEEVMTTYQFATTLKVENVQELIDNEQPKFRARDGEFGWTQYHTLEEIYAWLDLMLEQYSTVLTPITAGNSYEGQPIRGVLLSYREGNPAVFIESNTHAREWITSATATYILNEFLTSTDPDIRRIAQNYDWYIFPIYNPDGFRFTHENNRMWRKTRSRHGLICKGVDSNRNWGFTWQDGSGPGASNDVCSDTYAGPEVFSEPETRQIADFVLEHANHIKLYLSFHSYGQLLLYPWCYKSEPADNFDDLVRIGTATYDKLKEIHGTEYTVESAFDLYICTGSSIDWVYGEAGIKLGFTYEFRDTGRYGFILPADQIIPNAIEILQSIIAMLDESDSLGYMTP
ncbi:zinc carboxypeptidase-like [Phlebotomus papatasi]|uniref:zinc carboxypeptidase-like n=1 Tax=Phlebotomus papatasi TaxID=29031 RepID=UPI002483A033|nr:zinc carboxypeptidase-like [Phlebotomus papatasi]